MVRLEKRHMKHPKVPVENVRRLAKWLGLRHNIDDMSKRQLASLIFWLITRRDKKLRGLVVGNGWATGYWR